MTGTSCDTLVLGAGISGLAYAHALRGIDYRVLEASARAGGLVHSVRVEQHGLRYEHGPEAFPGGTRELSDLCRELGLETLFLGAGSKRWIVRNGRLVQVPLSPGELLETPLLGAVAKLRIASERFRDARTALDGSIADFVRHRLGREVLERLVDPLIGGIHAGDPERLSLRACFPEVARWVEEHGSLTAALAARKAERASGTGQGGGLWKPRGGMQRLSAALAAALGERLRASTRARRLERDGERWRVATDGETFVAQRVVLALPLGPTVELLSSAAPAAARLLAGMEAESLVAVVHAHARADVAHPLDGFGYLVPSSERTSELGTLFSSSIDPESAAPDTVVLRTLLGGSRAPEIVGRPDEELRSIVAHEVGARLGIRSAPLWAGVERHPRALPRYDLEHPARIEAFERALPGGLHVLGNFTRGIGVAALVERARELARRTSPSLDSA